MTDDQPTIELSRRKVLGGLGGIGVASAGAALGTSAYFSDEENFGGNSLTAGELDLLLDYQVTYHGGPGRLQDVQAMGYDDAQPVEDEEGTYLLEEVPDTGEIEDWDQYVLENGFCGEDAREMLVNGDEVAPIRIEDVKPGDSGCLTTSLHLCDNPAYVWMTGELVENDDNGLTEPESDVDDSGGDGEGELAENVETTVWYDENCDCAVDEEGEGGEADVLLVLDVSSSMSSDMGSMGDAANGLVDELGSNANVGLVSYSTEPSDPPVQELTDDHGAVESAINGLDSDGQTNIEGGVVVAEDELLNGTNARSSADKYMVVMSDGNANEDYSGDGNYDPTDEAQHVKQDEGIELYTVSFGGDSQTLLDMASDPSDAHFFEAADEQELIDAFADIGQTIAGERVIFEGTLAELTGVLSSGDGIPLDGDRETDFDEVAEGEPAAGDGEGRECFMPSETHCIGLEWELPVDVGNEVQTDSVVFDVGFYAEQCRHNDGTGAEPATNGSGGNSTTS